MKKLWIVWIIIIMSATSVWAETITLVTGEFPPYTSEALEDRGFSTEIISAVFQEMGKEVEYTFYPWRRCEELVQKGKAWATFPYTHTEEREKVYLFSDNISDSITHFFYYKENKAYTYNTLEDLKDYKVGGLQGYFYEPWFEEAGLEVTYTYDHMSIIRQLINGRIELAPLNVVVGWHTIKTQFPDEAQNFDYLEKPLLVGKTHVIASKQYPGSAELLEEFNAALQRIKENGTHAAILEKYGIKVQ